MPTHKKTTRKVFDVVQKDPDALGIISVSWLGDDLSLAKKVPVEQRNKDYANQNDTIATKNLTTEVNVVRVSNPTEANDFDPYRLHTNHIRYIHKLGEYPLFRKVYMISTASNSTVLHSFLHFCHRICRTEDHIQDRYTPLSHEPARS